MKYNDTYELELKQLQEIFPKKVLLSKDEVMSVTGRSRSSLNRDIAEGKGIPFVKSRRRVFFPITALAQYIASTIETL